MHPLLTPRELTCLRWAAIGKTSWEIGAIVGLTERTINFHIGRACQKLGVHRRQAAVAIALQHGLLPTLPCHAGSLGTASTRRAGGPMPRHMARRRSHTHATVCSDSARRKQVG